MHEKAKRVRRKLSDIMLILMIMTLFGDIYFIHGVKSRIEEIEGIKKTMLEDLQAIEKDMESINYAKVNIYEDLQAIKGTMNKLEINSNK
ncbi:TPA: hypothetical protein KSK13_003432 [Clostridioides difficile]|nr:hypothetical protein [Clostridioides difficile]